MNIVRMNWLAGVLALALAPGAAVSLAAVYTDDFNRDDDSTLGANWAAALGEDTTGGTTPVEHGISSGVVPTTGGRQYKASYYSHVLADGAARVKASIDFRAGEVAGLPGYPSLELGINYRGAGGGTRAGQPHVLVQGNVNFLLFVDGDWRGRTTIPIPLTPGEWYRLTVEQTGADFTGTLSQLDGTILAERTHQSLLQTSATGAAYFWSQDWGGTVGNPAFDNFTLEIAASEPGARGVPAAGEWRPRLAGTPPPGPPMARLLFDHRTGGLPRAKQGRK